MKSKLNDPNIVLANKRRLLIFGGCAVVDLTSVFSSGYLLAAEPRDVGRYVYLKIDREVNAAVPLASCGRLKQEADYLQERAKKFRNDASGKLAQDYVSSIVSDKEKWKSQIPELRRLVEKGEIDKAFGFGNLIASAVLGLVGAAFSSPLAVGTVVVAQVVGGTALFGWQLALVQGKSGPDDGVGYVLGYQGDRVFMLSGEALKSSVGAVAELARGAISAISVLIATWNYYSATKDSETARLGLRIATKEFELTSKIVDEFGTDSTKWREYLASAYEASGASLLKFIKQYEKSDCRLIGSVNLKRDSVIKIDPMP